MRRNRHRNSNPEDSAIDNFLEAFEIVLLGSVSLVVVVLTITYFWIPGLPDSENCLGIPGIPCSEVRNFVQDTAISAVPVGIASMLGYLTVRRAEKVREQRKNSELASLVVSEIEQSLAKHAGIQKKFTELGITDCYMSLDTIKDKALELHFSNVRIMTTWFTNAGVLYQLFNNVARHKDYRIRILLLDPTSAMAEQRSRDLGEVHADTVPHHIRECRAAIEGLKLNGVEIKYYNALPSFPLYIFGNHAFFGVFPHGAWADRGPWFAVDLRDSHDRQTDIGRFLTQQFDKAWKDAVAVTRWDQKQSTPSSRTTLSPPS